MPNPQVIGRMSSNADRRKARIAKLNEAIKRADEARTTTITHDASKPDLRGKSRPATPEESHIASDRVKQYQASLEKEIRDARLEEERQARREAREDEIDAAAERKLN